MKKQLMRGNEALAEAVVRAGCGFYAGYPITPQSEVLEYLSWRMPEEDREFIQCESELAAISMVYGASATGQRCMTSTSGPGFALMQEGISYIASAELPCLLLNVQRYGSGLGDINIGQSDYWMATRNGGHSDYRVIVLAPNSVQESADLVFLGFDLAEKHRNPVLLLSDAAIAEMIESVGFDKKVKHDQDKFDWALKGKGSGQNKRHTSVMYYMEPDEYNNYLREKYAKIEKEEQLWESLYLEDAELVLVSYGISSRICMEAIETMREGGFKVGLIRPITLYPFPKRAFENLPNSVKSIATVEMSAFAQMMEDVALVVKNKDLFTIRGGARLYSIEEVIEQSKDILLGKSQEIFK